VAVFSDVHGNLLALERFLEATRHEADAYVCLGDVVDYGPWSDECVDLVLSLPRLTLLEGNHERLFLGTEDPAHEPPLVREFLRHVRPSFTRTAAISGLPGRASLGPFECAHTIDGRSIYADTAVDVDRPYLIGHTHHQYSIGRSGFAILNPGSVGQNRKWIDRVDYLLLDLPGGAPRFRSEPYAFDRFLAELRSRQYPEPCIAYYAGKPRSGT
jgi:hypothetical protein